MRRLASAVALPAVACFGSAAAPRAAPPAVLCLSQVPGLRAAPFWLEGDGRGAYADGLEWLAELEAAVPRIRDELDAVLAAPLPAALARGASAPPPPGARDGVMAASGATARALARHTARGALPIRRARRWR